jgi:hypothetical protein
MASIEIKKTGNFWVDNGIVALYKVLRRIEQEEAINCKITINHDCLLIETISEDVSESDVYDKIIQTLEKARLRLTKEYTKISDKNFRWYYDEKSGDFHLFPKSSYKHHLRETFFSAKPEYEGTLHLPNKEKEVLNKLPKKKNMTEDIHKKFLQFQNANQEVFDKKITAKERDEGFLNGPSKYTFGNVLSETVFKRGNKRCWFSSLEFQEMVDINGMYSPFFTSASGELNFASFLGKKPKISSLYAYISLFAPYNMSYSISKEGLKNYFVLYDSSLRSLSGFIGDIQKTLDQTQKADFCNFETSIIGTKYEKETLFNFLLSIYKQVRQQLGRDVRKEVFTKSVFVLSNDGNIFRQVEEYSSLESLFQLFDSFAGAGDVKSYLDEFVRMVQHFNKKIKLNEYDTTWRNRLCGAILSFSSIIDIIERFLGEVKMREENGGILYLDKILEIYIIKTQPNMKAEMVEVCKSLGNRIGRYCREKEDKGILFSIRNAKSRNEFLAVLSETQFRTEVLYSEDFFKELPDNAQWEEYKSLVSIFAMNSFLYRPESKKLSTNQ